MLGFPADEAPGVCDGGATHQHTGHDSGAVRGAETGWMKQLQVQRQSAAAASPLCGFILLPSCIKGLL